MKSFLLSALAALLCLATTSLSAPTPFSLENAHVEDGYTHATNDVDVYPRSAAASESDLATVTLAERADEGMANVEYAKFKCNIHTECPNGYHKTAIHGESCLCFFFGGGWKRDIDLEPPKETPLPRIPFDPRVYCANTLKGKCPDGSTGLWRQSDGRCYCGSAKPIISREQELEPSENYQLHEAQSLATPFDPRVYCANTYKGKCPGGTTGLWNKRDGRCYCGSGKAVVKVASREEHGAWSTAINHDAFCAEALKDRCPDSTVSLWSEQKGHCYCDPTANKPPPTNSTIPAGLNVTTSSMLINRLLPQPLKFPSGISSTDYAGIITTLVLLDEYVKSQPDLHQVCTGTRNPQAYGFQLNIFRRICSPEITTPVSQAQIVKAQLKVLSLQLIDTILQRNNNTFEDACEEANSPDVIPYNLDKAWIMSKLCYPDGSVAK